MNVLSAKLIGGMPFDEDIIARYTRGDIENVVWSKDKNFLTVNFVTNPAHKRVPKDSVPSLIFQICQTPSTSGSKITNLRILSFAITE